VFYFYIYTLKEYPPGPTPLPLIGNGINLLFHVFSNKHKHEIINEIGRDYGPVFTLWFEPFPYVFVLETQSVMEVLKSKSFSGRPHLAFLEELKCTKNSISTLSADLSKEWEVLRKVSYTAARRTTSSPLLPYHAVHVLDQVADKMIQENERKSGINVDQYMDLTTLSLLSSLAFGYKFNLEDKEFKETK